MDLLTHMFDNNLRSKITWNKIKRDDPNFLRLLVSIAQDPRGKKSITAAVDIAEVGRDIGRNTNLKSLELDDLHCLDRTNVNFSRWIFGLLCEGINDNQSIEQLTVSNFSHNQWEIGQFLGHFLENSPNLRSVCVMTGGGYTRSAENMRLLVSPLLGRNGPLDELCFIESGVNDDMVVALVEVFLKDPSLAPVELQLAACEFGLVGCRALSKLLKSSSCSVVTLDLVDNYIEDDGAACLADALTRNKTLQELLLAGNRITSTGWAAFRSGSCRVSRHHD